jgi:hypothetical protein
MSVGGERHVPAALAPGERHGTHCIGGWVRPRAGLYGWGQSRPHRDSIPGWCGSLPVIRVYRLSSPGLENVYE